MRLVAIVAMGFVLIGCTGKIAVVSLESTITQAALSAQRATNGASKKLTIDVSVTNGYRAGTDTPIPVPVVPIDVSFASSTTTKLKLDVDLETFRPPAGTKSAEPEILMLDTRTGLLSVPTQ